MIVVTIIFNIKCGKAKFISVDNNVSIPVAARSKTRVCGRSLAEFSCSNPAVVGGGGWGSEFCVLSGIVLCDEPITHPEESY
jgi:hypothetical protein